MPNFAETLKQIAVYKVNGFELMRHLAKCYNIKTMDIGETPNDSYYFEETEELLEEYDLGKVAEFLNKEYVPHWYLGTLLSDAANKGFIPHGKYLIQVSW